MQVHVGQIYVEPGVDFPLSFRFQLWLGQELTSMIRPSPEFLSRYGDDFSLMFRMSAKRGITQNEIRGPSVFRKARDVEYTIFLPFDLIDADRWCDEALGHLISGIIEILDSLKIDTAQLARRANAIVAHTCTDPAMIKASSR